MPILITQVKRPVFRLFILLLCFVPVGCGHAATNSTGRPPTTFLVLGDSLSSHGIKSDPTCSHSVEDATGAAGWACIFYRKLQGLHPRLKIDSLAVGGTDTCSFAGRQPCFSMRTTASYAPVTPARGSQWERALAVLRARPNQVSPISIELGVNDLNAPTNPLLATQTRLKRILRSLRAAAPRAVIIVFDAYNPYPTPKPAITDLDAIDKDEAGRVGALFVDLMAPFTGHANEYVVSHDTHPTPLGDRVIARTIWNAYQSWNSGNREGS